MKRRVNDQTISKGEVSGDSAEMFARCEVDTCEDLLTAWPGGGGGELVATCFALRRVNKEGDKQGQRPRDYRWRSKYIETDANESLSLKL